MTINGLNHATLATRDLTRAIAFYRDVLGCRLRARWPEGAYLAAGSLWLCLSYDPQARDVPHPDDTHLAFNVEAADFAAFERHVRAHARIWRDNRSEGASVYFLDPDGHKLEAHLGSLESRLAAIAGRPGVVLHD